MWYNHTVEYYLSVKIAIYATIYMGLEVFMLNERKQTEKPIYFKILR